MRRFKCKKGAVMVADCKNAKKQRYFGQEEDT
jgi:hypothetical protein